MTEIFLVKIDLARLRPRLSTVAGRDLSHGDAFQWLRSKGFHPSCGAWVAPTPALHALEPGEIITSSRLGDRA